MKKVALPDSYRMMKGEMSQARADSFPSGPTMTRSSRSRAGGRYARSQGTAEDEAWMYQALALAAQGRGHVEPNPMVGCVLVKDGHELGRGYHEKFGQPHAERGARSAYAFWHRYEYGPHFGRGGAAILRYT